MEPITVVTNTGLGDFFVLSGALVYLVQKYGRLRFPCLPQNYQVIRLCLGMYPEIEIFTVEDDDELLKRYPESPLYCHWRQFQGGLAVTESNDRWMYEKLGVDFNHRWRSCPLESAASKIPQIIFPGPYYLLHEDPERGFPITYPPWHPVITTRRTAKYGSHTSLAWVDAIRRAKELHFIDSSFWHLANSIDLDPDQPKYLHRYVRQWHPIWHNVELKQMWRFIDGTPTRVLRTKFDTCQKNETQNPIKTS
jgi:hypothetical protein